MTLNRREFLRTSAGASAAAVLVGKSKGAAAKYDLIIRGGRVIDPSVRLDTPADLAISGGRIAAIEPAIHSDAGEVIEARGKLVVPGLIDIHTHAALSPTGPHLILQDGVTGWIDAGSKGADGIDAAVAGARSSPQLARVLINIGRAGATGDGDTMDLKRADVDAAHAAIAKNRDFVVGVKARLSRDIAGPNDYEVLMRAQQVASSFGLPVMIHMGQTVTPFPKLVELLKRGDIVTHMFAPPPNSIIDENGHIFPEVLAARRRGVYFDVGNGQTGHMRWDMVGKIMKAGFWPDTFSSDWTPNSRQTGVVDLPNCMSKLFGYGMTLKEAIARGTLSPARVFAVFNDRGTLNIGAPANVAILELREGDFEFLDNFSNKITGHQRLFPSDTVLNGQRVSRS